MFSRVGLSTAIHVEKEDNLLKTTGLPSEPVDGARLISTSTRRELPMIGELLRQLRGGGMPVATLVVEVI